MTKKPARWKSYLYLLINALCWGAALIIVKPSFEHTTPFLYLFYRFALASLLCIPIIYYHWRRIAKPWQALKVIVPLELLGTTISLGLLYLGLQHTTAIESSLIANTTPLFTVFLGIMLLKEREENREWLGLLLAFLGTILLVAVPLYNGYHSLKGFSLLGNVLVFSQNITTALYYVLAKKHYQKLPKLFVTSISFYVGLISFFVFSLAQLDFNIGSFYHTALSDLAHPSVLLAVVYMATFGSIIGLTTYIKAQEGMEASEASLFTYLHPLISIPFAIILLRETVLPLQFIAMVVILTGVFIAEKRTRRARTHKA